MRPKDARRASTSAPLVIWVQPGASRQRIVGMRGDALKIAVTAPPEKGAANRAVEKLLAEEFHVAAGAVTVTAGGSSRLKRVTLQGVGPETVRAWLDRQTAKG